MLDFIMNEVYHLVYDDLRTKLWNLNNNLIRVEFAGMDELENFFVKNFEVLQDRKLKSKVIGSVMYLWRHSK